MTIHDKIKCDCCGVETLAEIVGDKVVIMDKRHGRKHIAVLTFHETLEWMKRFASFTLSVLSLSVLTSGNRKAHKEENYHKIKCECCGTETMGEVRGDKVIIMDKRHGRRHIAVLTLRELLDRMRLARKSDDLDEEDSS